MKASIFCIGTELVDGQITNRNAPWISKKLNAFGIETLLHLNVPDDRPLMLKGLQIVSEEAELIFVTGGLGPTSDDFTREIIAEWSQSPLRYHPDSWDHLTQRLHSRGAPIKEIQKQQCYFPDKAEILINPEGTANAFYLEFQNKKVFVLPGPPTEIEAIWNASIDPWLVQRTGNFDPRMTKKWETLGKGEAEIATLVEQALGSLEIEKGYRVHQPYVEVKLSFKKSQSQAMQPWIDKVEQVLKAYTATRDDEDLAETFSSFLKTSSFSLEDEATGTFLLQRLLPRLHKSKQDWAFSTKLTHEEAEFKISISKLSDFSCEVRAVWGNKSFHEVITSPYHTEALKERSQQYLAEMILLLTCRKFA